MEEMTSIHIGQGWDIEMQVNKRLPFIEDYRNTVKFKTGVFPRFLIKSIFTLYDKGGENKEIADKMNLARNQLVEIADYLSIAFQIKDDLLNITDSNVARSKGSIGEDIYEGKYTLMIIHSFEKDNKLSQRLREIIEMKTNEQNLINEAIDILRENKSIEFATKIMNENANKAIENCEKLREGKTEIFNYNVTKDIEDLLLLLINL